MASSSENPLELSFNSPQKIIASIKLCEIFVFAERYEVFKVLRAFAFASYARAYEFSIVSGNAKSLALTKWANALLGKLFVLHNRKGSILICEHWSAFVWTTTTVCVFFCFPQLYWRKTNPFLSVQFHYAFEILKFIYFSFKPLPMTNITNHVRQIRACLKKYKYVQKSSIN